MTAADTRHRGAVVTGITAAAGVYVVVRDISVLGAGGCPTPGCGSRGGSGRANPEERRLALTGGGVVGVAFAVGIVAGQVPQ